MIRAGNALIRDGTLTVISRFILRRKIKLRHVQSIIEQLTAKQSRTETRGVSLLGCPVCGRIPMFAQTSKHEKLVYCESFFGKNHLCVVLDRDATYVDGAEAWNSAVKDTWQPRERNTPDNEAI